MEPIPPGTEIVPYHWDDRHACAADATFARETFDEYMPRLAEALDAIHSQSRGQRYWRLLAGPWLRYFIEILLDRWRSIECVRSTGTRLSTVVRTVDPASMVPVGMSDFPALVTQDVWNHRIYAEMIAQQGGIDMVQGSAIEPDRHVENSRFSRGTIADRALWRGLRILGARRYGVAAGTYLPRLAWIRLQLQFGQVPMRFRIPAFPTRCADPRRRDWAIAGAENAGFHGSLARLIPQNVPTGFLEGYADLMAAVDRSGWPESPRFVFTSVLDTTDDFFMAYMADRCSRGAPLILGQHGGHIGCAAWNSFEELQVEAADRYLTWGWTDPRYPSVHPVGQLVGRRARRASKRRREEILMVTHTVSPYAHHANAGIIAGQYLEHLEDQFCFARALPEPLRSRLHVRLYRTDYGWRQVERWRRNVPWARVDDGRASMSALTEQCALFVATYNATTFLETFASEIPTLMFWNPRYWEVRDSARALFQSLREVGVLHDNPESAAAKVSAIVDDPEGWWRSADVRSAVDPFRHQYCRFRPDLADAVATAIRGV